MRPIFVFAALLVVLAALALWPAIDLGVSAFFYRPAQGFYLGHKPVFLALHGLAYYGARVLAIVLALAAVVAAIRHKPLGTLNAKAWLFLFLGLLIGPGLIANAVLKDHWGRARPREIAAFGGTAHFSPALVPSDQCARNCSFVSGDGAFGFYLPAFAYVVPRRRSRRVFWGGMGLGVLFGLARLAAGAHFLSDILFAAFFMQAVLALLHGLMFGGRETRKCWRDWLFYSGKSAA